MEDLTGTPAVLFSQTSSRPFGVARDYLRNRVAIVYAPMAPLRNRWYADATGEFFRHGNPQLFQRHGFWLRIDITTALRGYGLLAQVRGFLFH